MGAAGPTPPLLRQAQRRIAADRALMTATVRMFNHEVRPSQVFTPRFSMTTLAQALRRGRGHRRAIVREAVTVAVNEVRRRRAQAAPKGDTDAEGRSAIPQPAAAGDAAG
jgi:menaquinone-9 beta-reductase